MINEVRNAVLAFLNKNNYGYISPQDFNLYAKQAQLDIFEDLFYQYNYQINKENARQSGTGYADIKKGYKTMDWFEPLDEAAANYKKAAIEVGSDNDKLVRITEIDELLALGDENLSREVQDMLIN